MATVETHEYRPKGEPDGERVKAYRWMGPGNLIVGEHEASVGDYVVPGEQRVYRARVFEQQFTEVTAADVRRAEAASADDAPKSPAESEAPDSQGKKPKSGGDVSRDQAQRNAGRETPRARDRSDPAGPPKAGQPWGVPPAPAEVPHTSPTDAPPAEQPESGTVIPSIAPE